MTRVLAIAVLLLLTLSLSASTFRRFDAPLRFSPAIQSLLEHYEDGASAVTIVPPTDDEDDWTVIVTYPSEKTPEFI